MKLMKRILLFAMLVLSAISLCAQEKYDPRTNGNIIFKVVSNGFNLKDKIKVWNRSPYVIMQVVVCEVANNELKPLGTCTDVDPDESCDIASFSDNTLKYLKGRTIAIKAKGLKKVVGDQSRTKVTTPMGNVGVRHQSVTEGSANNIKPEDVTYEFEAKLFEDRHDLFIELYSASGNDVMDF